MSFLSRGLDWSPINCIRAAGRMRSVGSWAGGLALGLARALSVQDLPLPSHTSLSKCV